MVEGNFWKDNLRGRGNSPISPLPSIFPPSLFAFRPSFLASSNLPLLAWLWAALHGETAGMGDWEMWPSGLSG